MTALARRMFESYLAKRVELNDPPNHEARLWDSLPTARQTAWVAAATSVQQSADVLVRELEEAHLLAAQLKKTVAEQGAEIDSLNLARDQTERDALKAQRVMTEVVAKAEAPVRMHLWCPACGDQHFDVGEFATRPHKTHTCQSCGFCWMPSLCPTVGVRFLPGTRNEEPKSGEYQVKLMRQTVSDDEVVTVYQPLDGGPLMTMKMRKVKPG